MSNTNGADRNFPFSTRPTGWFQLGWSHEFPQGEVVPRHFFGQELVVYRGHSGDLHLVDAYCPHLGAHLGYGGRVEGNDLICPFHGWRFDGEGQNIDIPYSARKRTANRLGCWTVEEQQGVVYFWHDQNGIAPQWGLPKAVDDDSLYYPVHPDGIREYRLRIYPQFIGENAIDFSHFEVMHKAAATPRLLSVKVEGHIFRTELGMIFGGHAAKTWLTPQGPVNGILETEIHGVGLNIARFHGTDGTVSLVGVTPVDDENSVFFMTNWVLRHAGDDGDELPPIVRQRLEEQYKQAERDHVIWEHMRYVPNAPTTPEETEGYRALRTWARRFYPGEPEYREHLLGAAEIAVP